MWADAPHHNTWSFRGCEHGIWVLGWAQSQVAKILSEKINVPSGCQASDSWSTTEETNKCSLLSNGYACYFLWSACLFSFGVPIEIQFCFSLLLTASSAPPKYSCSSYLSCRFSTFVHKLSPNPLMNLVFAAVALYPGFFPSFRCLW